MTLFPILFIIGTIVETSRFILHMAQAIRISDPFSLGFLPSQPLGLTEIERFSDRSTSPSVAPGFVQAVFLASSFEHRRGDLALGLDCPTCESRIDNF